MQSVSLQALVRNQLAHRDTHLIVPLRVSDILASVANSQYVDRLQIGGKVKLSAQNIRLEVAHPNAAQAQLRGLEHHMIGQNGGVNVPGLLLVEGAHPRLVVVGADDDGKGRSVNVGRLADFRQSVLTLDDDQVNWLEVGGGGGT